MAPKRGAGHANAFVPKDSRTSALSMLKLIPEISNPMFSERFIKLEKAFSSQPMTRDHSPAPGKREFQEPLTDVLSRIQFQQV